MIRSKQLDAAIPASRIANLLSGDFVGTVADDPEEKIKLMIFHAEVLNEKEVLNNESRGFSHIPKVR